MYTCQIASWLLATGISYSNSTIPALSPLANTGGGGPLWQNMGEGGDSSHKRFPYNIIITKAILSGVTINQVSLKLHNKNAADCYKSNPPSNSKPQSHSQVGVTWQCTRTWYRPPRLTIQVKDSGGQGGGGGHVPITLRGSSYSLISCTYEKSPQIQDST